MSFGLVIFDCDGVLIDSEPIANRVFKPAPDLFVHAARKMGAALFDSMESLPALLEVG